MAIPLISLHLIQLDIVKAIESIKKTIILFKLKSVEVDDLIISSLWMQAVSCYAKAFTKSEDGFSKLEAQFYFKSDRALNIHEELMTLRNSYIAHRGNNEFEKSLFVVSIDKSNITRTYIFPTILKKGHYFKNYKSKLKHLEHLEKVINNQLQKKLKAIDSIIVKNINTYFSKIANKK